MKRNYKFIIIGAGVLGLVTLGFGLLEGFEALVIPFGGGDSSGDTPVVLIGDSLKVQRLGKGADPTWAVVTPGVEYHIALLNGGTIASIALKQHHRRFFSGTDLQTVPVPSGASWIVDEFTTSPDPVADIESSISANSYLITLKLKNPQGKLCPSTDMKGHITTIEYQDGQDCKGSDVEFSKMDVTVDGQIVSSGNDWTCHNRDNNKKQCRIVFRGPPTP